MRDNVGLSALEDLRIINRYYAQGLTEEEFNLAVKQILSEPNLDNVYTELSIPEDYRYFAMEYLPVNMTKEPILPLNVYSFSQPANALRCKVQK